MAVSTAMEMSGMQFLSDESGQYEEFQIFLENMYEPKNLVFAHHTYGLKMSNANWIYQYHMVHRAADVSRRLSN